MRTILSPIMASVVRLRHLWFLSGLALAWACEETTRPPPIVEPPATLARVEVRPATAMLTRGATLALTASAVRSDDVRTDVTRTAAWSSSDPAIATVSASGGVEAVGLGTVQITATHESKSGSATLTITALPLTGIALDRTSATIEAGATTTFVATGTFQDGATEDLTARLTWSASSTAATVTAGTVTGVSGGVVTITAEDPATRLRAQATVTVRPRLPTSIAITPSGVVLPLGRTQQYVATARYADGSEVDASTLVRWSSSNAGVASVDATGLAVSLTEGITSVTAEYPGGPRGSTTLSVGPPTVISLVVSPRTATIAAGQRQTFTAEARYTNGTVRDVTNAAMWSSSDPSIIAIGGADRNVARPVGTGTVTITAVEPMSGASSATFGTSARLAVSPPTLTGIVVTPNTQTIPFGAAQQFAANGLYSDATSRDLTASVMWSSSATIVATIDAAGLVTSVAQGQTTIDAVDPVTGISSATTLNGSASLTVSPPALLSIQVTPAVWTLIVGGTRQFVATGRFSDGMSRDITSTVEWRSSGPAVTINAAGLATAAAVGQVTVSARDAASMVSSDTTMESARVTSALANLVSIALVPTATSVPAGAEARLRAIGTYDNAATADLTNDVEWTVVTTSVAGIGNAAGIRGRVFRTRPGSTRVQAREPGTGISSGPAALVTITPTPAVAAITLLPGSAVVNVNRTLQLSARGRFADGQIHMMTNTVDWMSSSAPVATVGNTDGTRGRVTAVSPGLANISAVYAVTGVAAAPAAAITVEIGVITLGRTWGGPTVTVDSTGQYGLAVGSVAFTAADFPAGFLVTDVNVSINFLKTDGSCAAPLNGDAFHAETSFRLRGPTGTAVALAPSQTWTGGTAISPVTVVFDDAATMAPSGIPTSGTFSPNAPLAGFNGSNPVGTWVLDAGDTAGGDPLCVIGYTVTVTAQQ